MKYTLRSLLFAGVLSFALIGGVFSSTVSADIKDACDRYNADAKSACEKGYNDGIQCNTLGSYAAACQAGKDQAVTDGKQSGNNNNNQSGSTGSAKCGGAKTEFVSCDEEAGIGAIASIIKTIITIVTVLIGVIATGGITYGAILYASARDNQGQVQEAIGIIRNVAIGLILYGFTVAIINWLVPGGVIG